MHTMRSGRDGTVMRILAASFMVTTVGCAVTMMHAGATLSRVSPPGSPPIVAVTGVGGYGGGMSVTATGTVYGQTSGPLPGMSGHSLAAPMVGIAGGPTGTTSGSVQRGYYLVGADGGVFAFDGAPFYGSMGGKPLNAPIVGMTVTAGGYRLVAADGGVFDFGTAPFLGSMGGEPLNAPIVATSGDSGGYYLVGADGGVFTFGTAVFRGSMAGHPLDAPVIGIDQVPHGYFLGAADGGVFTLGGCIPGTTDTCPYSIEPQSFKGQIDSPVVAISTHLSPAPVPSSVSPLVVTSSGRIY